MIQLLKDKLKDVRDTETKINLAREFLQLLILKILADRLAFKHLAFVGGTALRILYDLRRFSEDLDFSLLDKQGYDFDKLMGGVLTDIHQSQLPVEARTKTTKLVHSAMLKFKGILWELKLSGFKEESLSVKVEVDTNPPVGAKDSAQLVVKDFAFSVRHLDLPSMFATKLHACFYRKYVKGRDFYDLVWYIGRRVEPNLTLLNEAVKQTEGVDPKITRENLKSYISSQLTRIDFTKVKKDVERFLVDKSELKLLDKELIISSVDAYRD